MAGALYRTRLANAIDPRILRRLWSRAAQRGPGWTRASSEAIRGQDVAGPPRPQAPEADDPLRGAPRGASQGGPRPRCVAGREADRPGQAREAAAEFLLGAPHQPLRTHRPRARLLPQVPPVPDHAPPARAGGEDPGNDQVELVAGRPPGDRTGPDTAPV